MKCAVYGVFLNEEKFLARMIQSAKKADLIILGDTGSTDTSAYVAIKNHVKLVNLTVRPWRFDVARNAVLAHIPEDIDVCISLDADESLCEGWRDALEAVWTPEVSRINHRFETRWDWDGEGKNITKHSHERIHSRHHYMWRSPVHEFLEKVTDGPELIKWIDLDPFMIQQPDNSKDRSSYLPMMERAVRERPEQWRIQWFLREAYQKAGRKTEADLVTERLKQNPHAKGFI